MSPRESRRSGTDRKRSDRTQTSVVGSRVRDVSSRLSGRGLPRGGIREQDGLKVADGALPDSTLIGAVGGPGTVRRALRVIAIVSGSLAAVLAIIALVVTVLSHTAVFTVTSIETYDSDHLTADNVVQLANVGEGVTLLNVDTQAIEENVRKNPWVASVEVDRIFPDRLRLIVQERTPDAVVAMGTGGLTWLLGDDGVWIEPLRIEVGRGESANDAALVEAERLGIILIADVPSSVSPDAGSAATDPSIVAVNAFRDQLSGSFQKQVASYSATSEDDISCVLTNGVEVSLGAPTNVETKENVALRILDEYVGQVTYINVRVPSRPAYRRVDSEFVHEGTGATGTWEDGDATAEGSEAATSRAEQPEGQMAARVSEQTATGEALPTGVSAL